MPSGAIGPVESQSPNESDLAPMTRNVGSRTANLIISAVLLVFVSCTHESPVSTLTGGAASGRERCLGADCREASKRLCMARGFSDGVAVDSQTEYCLEKEGRVSSNCVFVTHALCK
jgi:hypothetical protein